MLATVYDITVYSQKLGCTSINNGEWKNEKKDEQRSLYTNLPPVGSLGKMSPPCLFCLSPYLSVQCPCSCEPSKLLEKKKSWLHLLYIPLSICCFVFVCVPVLNPLLIWLINCAWHLLPVLPLGNFLPFWNAPGIPLASCMPWRFVYSIISKTFLQFHFFFALLGLSRYN